MTGFATDIKSPPVENKLAKGNFSTSTYTVSLTYGVSLSIWRTIAAALDLRSPGETVVIAIVDIDDK